jgi:hypothetical protein
VTTTYTTLDVALDYRERLTVAPSGACDYSGHPVSRSWSAWYLRQLRSLQRKYPGRFVTTRSRERAAAGDGR